MIENYGILGWIVIGLLAGGVAKLLMPGKDPGGCLITILLGIAGAATFRRRNSSRARRLARLRRTAEPSFRVAATPNRGPGPPFGKANTVMNRPWRRAPSL